MARILLVECDLQSRMWMHRALMSAGHDVVTAHEVKGALWLLRAAGPFDLVLAEIDLPGVSGIELALMIGREHPETAVLLMANHGPQSPV